MVTILFSDADQLRLLLLFVLVYQFLPIVCMLVLINNENNDEMMNLSAIYDMLSNV